MQHGIRAEVRLQEPGAMVGATATVRTVNEEEGNVDGGPLSDFWGEQEDDSIPEDVTAALRSYYGTPCGSPTDDNHSATSAGADAVNEPHWGEEGIDRRDGRAGALAYPENFEVSFVYNDELVTAHCSEAIKKDEAAWRLRPTASVVGKDEWIGDEFRQLKQRSGAGVAVFTFKNMRRIKQTMPERSLLLQQLFWQAQAEIGADFVGLADTGLVNGAGKNGHVDTAYSSGKARRKASAVWGGPQTVWGSAQGLAGGRGGDGSVCVEGGCVLAGHEDWRHRLDDTIMDSRGWGRYVGKVLRGAR